MRGEIGIQARVLQPGLHLLTPFLYKVRKDDMIVVAEDEVGLLESIDGEPLPAGHIFGRHVDLHDTYQDGEGFLRNGGQKGPQVDTLHRFDAPGQLDLRDNALGRLRDYARQTEKDHGNAHRLLL